MPQQAQVSEFIRPVAAACTHASRLHAQNEDAWWTPQPDWLTPQLLAAKGYLYIVADGIGGQTAGNVASRTAIEAISQTYYQDPDPAIGISLERAIQTASGQIHHMAQQPTYHGMGSTVVAAVIRGQELVIAHAGDSRAYLLRDGGLRQLTNDHTWVAEGVAKGLLTLEEAANHPQRNVVTRSLGERPQLQPDVNTFAFLPGDRLLLCSDGVSGVLPGPEIAERLGAGSPDGAAKALVRRVKALQGADDATALVVGSNPVQPGALGRLAGVLSETLAFPQQRLVLAGIGVVSMIIVIACILVNWPSGGRIQATPTSTSGQVSQVSPTLATTSPTVTSTPTMTWTATTMPAVTPTLEITGVVVAQWPQRAFLFPQSSDDAPASHELFNGTQVIVLCQTKGEDVPGMGDRWYQVRVPSLNDKQGFMSAVRVDVSREVPECK